MKKKITIIGRGTVGVSAAAHFSKWADNCEIDWIYDPSIDPAPVGEGTTLTFPQSLRENLNFNSIDMDNIDSTAKLGIHKTGWGKSGTEFIHPFPVGEHGVHFNAVTYQKYVFDKLKSTSNINFIEDNADPKDLDSDFIMSCVGSPKTLGEDNFIENKNISVNACYVSQCPWDLPRFNYTLTHAKKYGWIFGIPLQNRCAIGYLYNDKITTLEEVKRDVKEILSELNLTPKVQRNISFNSYRRKNNFEDGGRIVYNGNASFFLEPLEATSTQFSININRLAYTLWDNELNNKNLELANYYYNAEFSNIERMISLHYLNGSIYENEFWKFASNNANRSLREALVDTQSQDFVRILKESINSTVDDHYYYKDIATWNIPSYKANIEGLGIKKELEEILKEHPNV